MPLIRKRHFRTTLVFFFRIADLEPTKQCDLSEMITPALHLCSFTELRLRNALHNATTTNESSQHYTCVRLQVFGPGTHYTRPPLRKSHFRSTLLFVHRVAGLERITQCHLKDRVSAALHLFLFTKLQVWNALHNATFKEDAPPQYTCVRLFFVPGCCLGRCPGVRPDHCSSRCPGRCHHQLVLLIFFVPGHCPGRCLGVGPDRCLKINEN